MQQREVGWCETSIVLSEVHPGAERLNMEVSVPVTCRYQDMSGIR